MHSPSEDGSGSADSKGKVRTLAAASFLNDMGSDMIYPFWPLFVTQYLGANMAILGLLDGVGEALVSISKAASGYLSDLLRKRKVFIWTGYLLGSFSRIGYAISPSWGWLLPFRIMDRSGKIRSSPRDAMVADASSDQNRGRNFGLVRSMDNLGAVFGIVIGIILFRSLGYRTLFLLAAIPSLFAAMLIFRRIRERKTSKARAYKGISFRSISSSLRVYILLSGIFALGSFSYSFLLIFSRDTGVAEGTVPVFYLLFTAVASVFSILFGRLSDRIGRERVIMLSLVIWAGVCSLMVIYSTMFSLIISFLLYGLHKGSLDPVQGSLVSEMAHPDLKASTIGGFQMIIGLCALPSSLIAGILWDSLGPRVPFFLSIILTGISMMLLFPMSYLRTKVRNKGIKWK